MSTNKLGAALTLEQINDFTIGEFCRRADGTRTMACTLSLKTGFAVTGYSSSAPEFDGEGNRIDLDVAALSKEAREWAIKKVRQLPDRVVAGLLGIPYIEEDEEA